MKTARFSKLADLEEDDAMLYTQSSTPSSKRISAADFLSAATTTTTTTATTATPAKTNSCITQPHYVQRGSFSAMTTPEQLRFAQRPVIDLDALSVATNASASVSSETQQLYAELSYAKLRAAPQSTYVRKTKPATQTGTPSKGKAINNNSNSNRTTPLKRSTPTRTATNAHTNTNTHTTANAHTTHTHKTNNSAPVSHSSQSSRTTQPAHTTHSAHTASVRAEPSDLLEFVAPPSSSSFDQHELSREDLYPDDPSDVHSDAHSETNSELYEETERDDEDERALHTQAVRALTFDAHNEYGSRDEDDHGVVEEAQTHEEEEGEEEEEVTVTFADDEPLSHHTSLSHNLPPSHNTSLSHNTQPSHTSHNTHNAHTMSSGEYTHVNNALHSDFHEVDWDDSSHPTLSHTDAHTHDDSHSHRHRHTHRHRNDHSSLWDALCEPLLSLHWNKSRSSLCVALSCAVLVLLSLTAAVVVLALCYDDVLSKYHSLSHSSTDTDTQTSEFSSFYTQSHTGIVATDITQCSALGRDVLEKYAGNAVDAAIAAALCVGVLSPASSGIGGGCYALIHVTESERERLQARQRDRKRRARRTHTSSGTEKETHRDTHTQRRLRTETDKEYDALPDENSFYVLREVGSLSESARETLTHATHSRILTETHSHAHTRTTQYDRLSLADVEIMREMFIDAREIAPNAANETMFAGRPMAAQNGGLAVAVLGEVQGLYTSFTLYGSGRIPWKDLVEPTAKIAESWTISRQLSLYIKDNEELLLSGDYPELSKLYVKEVKGKNGKKEKVIKEAGDNVKQPELAFTLRQIGKYGPDYLHSTVAATLAEEIQRAGGVITAEDLSQYTVTLSEPIRANITGYEFVSVGGSSSGGIVVLGLLRFMQSFAEPLFRVGELYYHRLTEAMKHVFAMRLSLGDPHFVDVSGVYAAFLSEDYIPELRRTRFSDATVQPSLEMYGGVYNMTSMNVKDAGTTHISVVDAEGNAVSLTSTINTYFGSKVVSPSTGILFNNQMDDFSVPGEPNYFGLAPSPLNYPAPKKKPLSSMSPSLLLDTQGRLRLVGGASGGPKIITATAQVFLNYMYLGMDILSAVVAPRLHSQLLPDRVQVEDRVLFDGHEIAMPASVFSLLESKGHHNVTHYGDLMGVSQFIVVDPDTGLLEGVSDPRKDGQPAGIP